MLVNLLNLMLILMNVSSFSMDVSNLLYEAMSVKLGDTFMFCVVFSIDQSSYFVWVIFCDILTSLLYSPGILCA